MLTSHQADNTIQTIDLLNMTHEGQILLGSFLTVEGKKSRSWMGLLLAQQRHENLFSFKDIHHVIDPVTQDRIEFKISHHLIWQRESSYSEYYGSIMAHDKKGHGGNGTTFESVGVIRLRDKIAHLEKTDPLNKRIFKLIKNVGLTALKDTINEVELSDIGGGLKPTHIVAIPQPNHEYAIVYEMELVPGENLADLLQKDWRNQSVLTIHQRLHLIIAIATTCENVSQRVVHGDLKPDNLFAKYDPHTGHYSVKAVDFGNAKLISEKNRSRLAGTPGFMAPELFEGKANDVASDIFSFAVIVLLILRDTNALPAREVTEDEDKSHAFSLNLNSNDLFTREDFPALSSDEKAILKDYLNLMLNKNPALRPQSFIEISAFFIAFTDNFQSNIEKNQVRQILEKFINEYEHIAAMQIYVQNIRGLIDLLNTSMYRMKFVNIIQRYQQEVSLPAFPKQHGHLQHYLHRFHLGNNMTAESARTNFQNCLNEVILILNRTDAPNAEQSMRLTMKK